MVAPLRFATRSDGRGAAEYAYDGAGRQTEIRQVVELNSTRYSSGAFSYRSPLPGAGAGGDHGMVQLSRFTYDQAGNATELLTLEANHDDTDGLKLDSSPKDFIQTTTFAWYDSMHRLTDVAACGTNAGGWAYADTPTRTSSAPSRSDTILVSSYSYDTSTGRLSTVTDPKGLASKYLYDALGRATFTVENYVDFVLSGTTPTNTNGGVLNDEDRTTQYAYNGLSRVTSLTALDPDPDNSGDDQKTRYLYESPQNAAVATNVIYPDSGNTDSSGDDQVKLAYWLDGRLKSRTSQKHAGQTATLIEYEYDSLRRLARQQVTTPGTNVDDGVRAIKYAYDNLGRREKVTSCSDTAGTTAVNEVAFVYNDFGALVSEYQEHAGTVDTQSSPYVGYEYDAVDDGTNLTKGLRFRRLRYPDGRYVHYTYGSGGSIADKTSRLAAIKDDDGGEPNNVLASYSYNGSGRLVVEDFEQPDVKLDYFGGTAGTYDGFDRFGRVVQQAWSYYGGTPAEREKFSYAYDRDSNRIYRTNDLNSGKDELYSHDNLNRLVDSRHGTLQTSGTTYSIASAGLRESFTLSQVGSWNGYMVMSGTTLVLSQTRSNNLANEITGISGSWAQPAYDARGNIITAPKPAAPTVALTCKYDAWNRLVEVKQGESVLGAYKYDGLHRRIRKTVSGDTYDDYYNAAWQLVEQHKTTGESTSVYAQYVWSDRYIDAPVLRWRDSDGDGVLDQTHYYLTDANMNVTALVNGSGTIVERYLYDAYGQVHVYDGSWQGLESSAVDNTILFAGYRLDSETGLYHVRYRMYHPMFGWMQRDPIGYVDGMSLYQYVGSKVTVGRDPSGLAGIENGWSQGDTVVCTPWGWWKNDFGMGTLEWISNDMGWGIRTWDGSLVKYSDAEKWADSMEYTHNQKMWEQYAAAVNLKRKKEPIKDWTDALDETARRFRNWCKAHSCGTFERMSFDCAELLGNPDDLGAIRMKDGSYRIYRNSDINYIFQGIATQETWWQRIGDGYSAATAWKWVKYGCSPGDSVLDWVKAGYGGWTKDSDIMPRTMYENNGRPIVPYPGSILTLGAGWDPNDQPTDDRYK